MHELITDRSFDLNRTNEYKLSIQVSLGGFSFSVIHIAENRLLALYNSPVTISTEKFLTRRFQEWANSEDILNHSFAEVRVQYDTPNFTVVPQSYFSGEKQNQIAALLFEQEAASQVVTIHPEKLHTQFLFSVPANLPALIANKFGTANLWHPAATMAQNAVEHFRKNENGAVVFFSKSTFFLLMFSGEKLLLANSYNYQHPNDVAYFLMAALNRFNLKPTDFKLEVCGEIYREGETETLLGEYFNQIEFCSSHVLFDSEIFKNLHRFKTLL